MCGLRSFIVSCQSIGAFASCFIVVPLEKRFGTKHTLMFLNNFILFAGSIAFFFASFHINAALLLIIGRLLIGIYTGIGCALMPIFIQELSPTELKVRFFIVFFIIIFKRSIKFFILYFQKYIYFEKKFLIIFFVLKKIFLITK